MAGKSHFYPNVPGEQYGASNPQWRSFPSDTPDFESINDNSNSTVTWISTVNTLIVVVAIVAIVVAVVNCCRKTAGDPKQTYTRISNKDGTSNLCFSSTVTPNSDTNDVKITIPPDFEVIKDTEKATVERFISDMAKENPIRFSPKQLEGFTKNYSTELGSGGFGIVYKGKLPSGEEIAVKILNNNLGKKAEQQFMAEVSTIGRTYHINLVSLYGFCFDPTMRALVYEYMENGSLDQYLFTDNSVTEWDELHKIAVGTAKGIMYLHEECKKRIIHYDIKPANVLLDAVFTAKIADFGLAKLCNRDITHVEMTGCRGTPGYAAPELWKPYPVTHKCDVYSFGMLLFEIVGRRRNHDANLSETREWLPRWTWESFDKGELAELMELCGIEERNREKAERMSVTTLWCIQYLPEGRPQMSSIVKMLEAEQDISPPPNPFQYLELLGSDLPVSDESSATSYSSSTKQTSDTSYYSLPTKRVFEIENSYNQMVCKTEFFPLPCL